MEHTIEEAVTTESLNTKEFGWKEVILGIGTFFLLLGTAGFIFATYHSGLNFVMAQSVWPFVTFLGLFIASIPAMRIQVARLRWLKITASILIIPFILGMIFFLNEIRLYPGEWFPVP